MTVALSSSRPFARRERNHTIITTFFVFYSTNFLSVSLSLSRSLAEEPQHKSNKKSCPVVSLILVMMPPVLPRVVMIQMLHPQGRRRPFCPFRRCYRQRPQPKPQQQPGESNNHNHNYNNQYILFINNLSIIVAFTTTAARTSRTK